MYIINVHTSRSILIDKRIIKRWPLMELMEQYTAYSVSVSAMETLFCSGNLTNEVVGP